MKDSRKLMTRFRFPSKVSRMGESKDGIPNRIIWIPKEYHDNPILKKLEGKHVMIQVDDEF